MIFAGRFIYVVTSGRVKLGPRYFIPGEEITLTEDIARSLYPTGQIRYKKRLPSKAKSERSVVPGETLARMPMKEMRRISMVALKVMAMKEFGIVEDSRDKELLIRRIDKTKRGMRNGLLHTG